MTQEKGEMAADLLATSLIGHFCGLEQAVRLYDLRNAVVHKVLEDILATVREFQRQAQAPMDLRLAEYSVFLNRRLVRMSFNDYRKAQQLKKTWSSLGIGEMVFPVDLNAEGLREFAAHLVAALNNPKASDLLDQDWGGISTSVPLEEEEKGEPANLEVFIIKKFCSLIVLVRQMVERVQSGQKPPMLRIKRTLQILLDRLEGFEPLLLALCRRTAPRAGLAAHLVNVAIYSLLISRRLGLSRSEMIGLATAALFHDLPKAALSDRTLGSLERPEVINATDRERVRLHWLSVLPRIFESSSLSDDILLRAVVAYEAQLEFTRNDLFSSGSPELQRHTLFSRIIALGDYFDTLTLERPGNIIQMPHQAMMSVISECGKRLDPGLGLLFIEALGLYPVGSAVLLQSGEAGVVVGESRAEHLDQPSIKIVADAQGKSIAGPEVDLTLDEARGIVWSMDATPLGINAVACLRRDAEPEAG